jgi:CO/xanthine dehydrogenase Mo-binding subunit
MVYTRAEVFLGTMKDFPFHMVIGAGVDREGKLTGVRLRAVGDSGPYGGTPTIAAFVASCTEGPYRWRSVDHEVRVAHTNGPHAGPMRGYGMPHGVFALETALDELAVRSGIDPWELRWKNALESYESAYGEAGLEEPRGFREVLAAIRPSWEAMRDSAASAPVTGSERRGAGLAATQYQFGKAGPLQVAAEAEITRSGRFLLRYTVQNSGQGLDTLMQQIGAETLGVPRSLIDTANNDTDLTEDSHIYGACKSAYWVGGAVREASRSLRHSLETTAAEALDSSPEALSATLQGIRANGDRNALMPWDRLALELDRVGIGRRFRGVFSLEGLAPAAGRPEYLEHYAVGAAAAEVAVDLSTGKTRLLRLSIAQDVGRVLNPLDLRGQIEGAAAMEIGAALFESYADGKTLGFRQYRLPRALDMPPIEVVPVEVAGRYGPFGAKGVGEAALGHVRAAILNAMSAAIGVRLTRLPATPARVLAALGSQGRME